MGEVQVDIELINTVDREIAARGQLPEAEVRHASVRAVVDTGAVMLMLPQDLVEALGLRVMRKAIVRYADERKEERDIAGTVTVRIGTREAELNCVVGPPTSEVLLGQIPLEAMDLLVDCTDRTLRPRPESPYLPLLKMKSWRESFPGSAFPRRS